MKTTQVFKAAIAGAAASLTIAMPAFAETEAEHAKRILGRDYAYPVCLDDQGAPVRYFERDEDAVSEVIYSAYAGARYLKADSQESAAILYNRNIFDNEPDIVLDFTFAHECYHLNSGDARQAYIDYLDGDKNTPQSDWVENIERDADCAAAIRLRDEFNYSAQDMAQLENIVLNTTSGTAAEQARLQNIEACYGQDIPFGEFLMANN